MSISHLKLFKRSNGKWYILFFEEGRLRWKSTGATKKQDALKTLGEFEDLNQKRVPKTLFSQFVAQFSIIQAGSLRASTLERIYKPAFEAFIEICGNKVLSAYSVKDVENFKRHMLTIRGASPTYVDILFRTLRAAFNIAINWELLIENPFTKTSRVRVPEKRPAFFTKAEFKMFLATVKEEELQDLYAFAVLTGMRQGEMLNLEWSSVDLEKRLVIVKNEGRFLTKTGKIRAVPLNEFAQGILNRRKLATNGCDFVFSRMGKVLTQSYVEHRLKHYVRKIGLDDRLRFHSLRHSFATWLVQGGEAIYSVSKLLGHSDIKVTERYSHLLSEELHSVVSKLSLK